MIRFHTKAFINREKAIARYSCTTQVYICLMKIDILTVLPELLESPLNHSILKRAQQKDLLTVRTFNLRKWAINDYGQVDDYQYGGGAGMVMMCEPLANAIDELRQETVYDEIIYMTPDAAIFDQKMANQLSLKENLLIICGHYKGIDQRIRDHYVTKEISIGNFVLSGGEIAAAIIVDAVGRLIPGVLNDETSALFDSFQDDLLAPPVYSRPAKFREWEVPEILLSGDPKKIDAWRYEQSLRITKLKRPELLDDDEII
jgi:tRNA (guanine37-N1)-methyltransferase